MNKFNLQFIHYELMDSTEIALIIIGTFYLMIAAICIVKRECKHQRIVYDESILLLAVEKVRRPKPIFTFKDMNGRVISENV